MIGFIKYMWNEYQKQKKIKILNDKLIEMVQDSKKLSGLEMKVKYGDVGKVFTNLQWECTKIKRGIDERTKPNSIRARSRSNDMGKQMP